MEVGEGLCEVSDELVFMGGVGHIPRYSYKEG
jgi:hypothetical protein